MKSTPVAIMIINNDVAPLVGAWIEILPGDNVKEVIEVAPLVGAWIEIIPSLLFALFMLSLLS